MLPRDRRVVAPDEFDASFRDDADIAEFASDTDEATYEARDAFLIQLIKRVVQGHCGDDYSERAHILEDLWPNHTRYLDIAKRDCAIPLLESLHDLLAGEFVSYRIQICVYGDIMAGESYVGSMVLYNDRVVVETSLDSFLQPY